MLDFDGDLYGQPARVRFRHRLRGQERFDDVDDLVAQMHRDVERVRDASAAASPGDQRPASGSLLS